MRDDRSAAGKKTVREWLRPTPAAKRGLIVLLWIVVFASAVVLACIWLERVAMEDASPARTVFAYVVFMFRTFTLHAAIALSPFLLLAILMRRRWLSVAVACCVLAFAWPKLASIASMVLPRQHTALASAQHLHAPSELRVLSMNVLVSNSDVEAAWAHIQRVDPDIVLLQEFTPTWNRMLGPRLLERFPYAVRQMRDHAFGQAIFSKRPFIEPPVEYLPQEVRDKSPRRTGIVGLHDPQIRVVIDLDGTPVVVQNVHTTSPSSLAHFREQRIQFAAFERLVREESRPILLAGDFNATENSRHVQLLLDAGLHDAHTLAGRGLGHTWPDVGVLRYFPGIRLDHALVRGLRVIESEVGPNIGSDHRPRFVRLILQ